jgi:hypothetical protein
MIIGMAFQRTLIVWLDIQQFMILVLVFQQAMIEGLN